MFEEQQKLADDAIDVTDMFELGAPSLVNSKNVIWLENLAVFLSYPVCGLNRKI